MTESVGRAITCVSVKIPTIRIVSCVLTGLAIFLVTTRSTFVKTNSAVPRWYHTLPDYLRSVGVDTKTFPESGERLGCEIRQETSHVAGNRPSWSDSYRLGKQRKSYASSCTTSTTTPPSAITPFVLSIPTRWCRMWLGSYLNEYQVLYGEQFQFPQYLDWRAI